MAVDQDNLSLIKYSGWMYVLKPLPPPLTNQLDHVTLGLKLRGGESSVILTTRVWDLKNSNRLLFETNSTDMVGEDGFHVGRDNPPASYLGMPGYFYLALVNGGTNPLVRLSSITLDNARVVRRHGSLITTNLLDNFEDNILESLIFKSLCI